MSVLGRLVLLLILLTLSTVRLCAFQASKHRSGQLQESIAAGSVENGTYRNSDFGFHYKVPFGWVERTEQMRDSTVDQNKSSLLLAVFERPPEARGDSVNSAVVITAERTSMYPGLKVAADYFVPLSEATTSKGFQVVNEPYYFSAGGRRVVRGDFSKKIGELTMHQSSLVMLAKGYIVSFTFLGGDDDEVNELIDNLQFTPRGKAGAGAH